MSPLGHHPWARVHGPLGGNVVYLRRFEGQEAMSRPFSFQVDLLATRALTRDDLLEKPLALEISPNKEGETRWIHGRVRAVRSLGRHTGFHVYRAELVPWLWFLSLVRDCRIFQEKTVKDILTQVFNGNGFTDFRFSCNDTYPKRDFTVQYRESDLDFVTRLMETNGLFYFFAHEKTKHTLVIADHQGALAMSPVRSNVLFRPAQEQTMQEGVIEEYSTEESVCTGGWVLEDYFYETPTANLQARERGKGDRARYDYPGGYRDRGEGSRLAKVRLQAEEVGRTTLVGDSTFVGLIPGYRFNLKESVSEDGDYLVASVRHSSSTIHYESAPVEEEDDEDFDYGCEFTAIPYATPFRPPRSTRRPHLGAQTAVVVGPKGEEIYTDKYGRVKVRFHWDRESPDDGKSSCWIRVASTWAGNKWGAIQIPRIGQEVVVDFLEGDPDRPLITGSVYNAQQMPPFGATPTQSGWKSHSSKQGAADSNEFRFEDKKDAEEIYLRAQKDLKVLVVNDQTDEVGNNRTRTVKKDEEVTVEGDQTIKVTKDQSVTVTTGNRTVEVKTGNLETKAAAGKMTLEAMQSIELKVGANSIKIDQTGITLKGMMVKIEGQTMTEIKGMTTKVEGQVMTEVKGAMVQVNATGMLMAKGSISMIG